MLVLQCRAPHGRTTAAGLPRVVIAVCQRERERELEERERERADKVGGKIKKVEKQKEGQRSEAVHRDECPGIQSEE